MAELLSYLTVTLNAIIICGNCLANVSQEAFHAVTVILVAWLLSE